MLFLCMYLQFKPFLFFLLTKTKTFTVDPGKYRQVDEIVAKATRNKGSLEVLDVCVTVNDDDEEAE